MLYIPSPTPTSNYKFTRIPTHDALHKTRSKIRKQHATHLPQKLMYVARIQISSHSGLSLPRLPISNSHTHNPESHIHIYTHTPAINFSPSPPEEANQSRKKPPPPHPLQAGEAACRKLRIQVGSKMWDFCFHFPQPAGEVERLFCLLVYLFTVYVIRLECWEVCGGATVSSISRQFLARCVKRNEHTTCTSVRSARASN